MYLYSTEELKKATARTNSMGEMRNSILKERFAFCAVLQDYFKKCLTVGNTFGVTVAANDQREKAQDQLEPLLTVIKEPSLEF